MNIFDDATYKELSCDTSSLGNNVISAEDLKIVGTTKISIEEETHEGVKIILNKDENDNIKEIKFVCSCGETKSVILDYNE